MTITITIKADNAAFDDLENEVRHVLSQVIPQKGQKLRDSNGNTVGDVSIVGPRGGFWDHLNED